MIIFTPFGTGDSFNICGNPVDDFSIGLDCNQPYFPNPETIYSMNCVRASNANGVFASLGSRLIVEKVILKVCVGFQVAKLLLALPLRCLVVAWPTAASKERKLQSVAPEKFWCLPVDHGKEDPLGPGYRY